MKPFFWLLFFYPEELWLNEFSLNNNQKFNLILSDISTKKTGNKITDQYQFYNIANNILEFSLNGLTSNGVLVIKVFIGHGFEDFKNDLDNYFENIYIYLNQNPQDRKVKKHTPLEKRLGILKIYE